MLDSFPACYKWLAEPRIQRRVLEQPVLAAQNRLRGQAWMLAAAALFAIMAVLGRLASQHTHWTVVAFGRSLVSMVIALGVARTRGISLKISDQRLAWGRSLCGACSMLCTFYTIAVPGMALGDVETLRSMSPVFVALLAPKLLGEVLEPRIYIATCLAIVGAAIITQPKLEIAGHVALICLIGAIATALAMIFLRKASARETPEAIALHFSLVATAVSIVLAIPTWRTPDFEGWVLLLATGIAAGLGQLAMTRAYSMERAMRVGVLGYLGVVMTQFLGVVVLGERPSGTQVLGCAVVVSAGILLAAKELHTVRAGKLNALVTNEGARLE